MISLALYQPDIPQNTGAAIRLCACLGVGLDIIEPCGFRWDKKKIRQSALDYFDAVDLTKYINWENFYQTSRERGRRIVLMTNKTRHYHIDFQFRPDDILLAGRESAGVPDSVHQACDERMAIPMRPGMRSLNVITASAMCLNEALRQTETFHSFKG